MQRNTRLLPLIMILVLVASVLTSARANQITIVVKTKALSIGSVVRLGEVAQIQVSDRRLWARLKNIALTKSPPPGESIELSISFVKRKVRDAGFSPSMVRVSGAKIVRITAAQNKANKVFFREGRA